MSQRQINKNTEWIKASGRLQMAIRAGYAAEREEEEEDEEKKKKSWFWAL